MSSVTSPELQPEQGQNPESLEAERLSAQLAYETLYAAENRLIPTIDQLKVAQEWVSGVHGFDQQGNALDDKGNLLMNAGSYAFVRNYFHDQNWLLGEHEKKALAGFMHKTKHTKDYELNTESLPATLANEIDAKLGPTTTPEEKQQRAEKVAHLRHTSAQLLSLDTAIRAHAADADAILNEEDLARAAQTVNVDYDGYLALYTEQMRSDHPDFDTLDAPQQAELLQRVTELATADAVAAKENRLHRQRQLRGPQEPVAAATQLESTLDTGKALASIEQALEELRKRGLDNITTIKELDKVLYIKRGRESSNRTAALLDILPPEARIVNTLSDPVDMLAKQSRFQLRSSRNKAADKALGAEIVARNAQLEGALAALNNYRDSLRSRFDTYQEELYRDRFVTIKDKIMTALEPTEPTPKLTPESLAAFLSSSDYAPRALELTLQMGRTDNRLLEHELHISVPRRELLVAKMVAAGLLSPERRGGGIRHTMVQSIDAFLRPPAPGQIEAPATPETPVTEATDSEPTTPKSTEAIKPQNLTDLKPSELRDIRLAISGRIKEHIAWIVHEKREQLRKPNATLGRREEEFYAKEAYEEALGEQIVKTYGINDRDPDYAQAIKDGVEALRYDLEKLRVKRASDVFANFVRQAGKELTQQALQQASNRYLSRLSPEDRETFVAVFKQLASEALSAKTAAKPKSEQPRPRTTKSPKDQYEELLKTVPNA